MTLIKEKVAITAWSLQLHLFFYPILILKGDVFIMSIKSLYDFELNRPSLIFPYQSNSFFNIGDGQINIFCLDDIKLQLSIYDGIVETGNEFSLNDPYMSLDIMKDTTLYINGSFNVMKNIELHGTAYLESGSSIKISNNSTITMYPNSHLIINKDTIFEVEDGSYVNLVGGNLDIHVSMVDYIINGSHVYIDSSVAVNIFGIDLGDRPFSLTDYELSLRDKIINPYTQGEYNSDVGRVGYSWTDGNPNIKNQCIRLSLIWGEIALGDFKLSVLGKQNDLIENLQVVSDIHIMENTILYIDSKYMQKYQYLRPELYLGIIEGNVNKTGSCIVDGIINVSGDGSIITLDRNATMHINSSGIVRLINQGIIRITNVLPEDEVLFIDGTLIIDDISQLVGFEPGNIAFGKNGKVVIKNPTENERRVLLNIPDGIHTSELYRLFENRFDETFEDGTHSVHVEYHISENTGIKIDKYYEYYNRDMVDWFGGRRIEKAIYDGILVWEDNGFIDLDNEIIPWVNEYSNLLQAAKLFKSFGSTDSEKLEEVAERLKYAGSGNILFRFIYNDYYHESTLHLESSQINSITSDNIHNDYVIGASDTGVLFMKNGIESVNQEEIINIDSTTFAINKGENSFVLK